MVNFSVPLLLNSISRRETRPQVCGYKQNFDTKSNKIIFPYQVKYNNLDVQPSLL